LGNTNRDRRLDVLWIVRGFGSAWCGVVGVGVGDDGVDGGSGVSGVGADHG